MAQLSVRSQTVLPTRRMQRRRTRVDVGAVARRLYDSEPLHRAVPWPVAKAAVEVMVRRAWESDATLREHARLHMRYLLEKSDLAADIDDLALDYAVESHLRIERWWRPWLTSRRPPRNLAMLDKLRRDGRGVIVNFSHVGDYEGHLASLSRAGVATHVTMASLFYGPEATRRERQIVRTVTRYGGWSFQAQGNRQRMGRLLREGEIVALASDLVGGTTVSVLGRQVRVASGAARLAIETGAWVVPLTAWREGDRRHTVLEDPLDPSEFTSPEDLLTAMMGRHEAAIRAWPSGFHAPLRRWAPADPADAASLGWSIELPLRI